MKILNISDRHLARCRYQEFMSYLGRLTELIKKKNINALFISADIFAIHPRQGAGGKNDMNHKKHETENRKRRDNGKHKGVIMPHLAISNFIKNSDMVRVVPVQAPKNYTADIFLRKGSSNDCSLPVQVKKTDLEIDYPFLTGELAEKLKEKSNYVAYTIKFLRLKGNPRYHQSIRSSKKSNVQRYSQAICDKIKQHLKENPDFNPYRECKKNNV